MNLGTRVEFLGRISDERLAHEYQRCTAVVMPSRGEGFGLVFIEAMRAARGCIGGHGSASEIIVDGDTGFVVDPENGASLRQAVVRMLRDRTGTAAMGIRGRARFLQHFTEDHFRSRLHALLPDAANTTRVRGGVESPWCLTRREHPRPQRVSRRRGGGAGPRRTACRGGRRGAVPPHQARGGFSAPGDRRLPGDGRHRGVGCRRVCRVARSARPSLAQGAVPAEEPAEGDGRVDGLATWPACVLSPRRLRSR